LAPFESEKHAEAGEECIEVECIGGRNNRSSIRFIWCLKSRWTVEACRMFIRNSGKQEGMLFSRPPEEAELPLPVLISCFPDSSPNPRFRQRVREPERRCSEQGRAAMDETLREDHGRAGRLDARRRH
jgi:hypothetical protein